MNLIKDIRLFESNVPNIDGNPTPVYMGRIYRYDHMACLDVIHRLLFLLRHRGFGYEGFDHLYLNFTPCIPHGTVQDVNRYNIREFSWYHYVDAGCDADLFNSWNQAEQTSFVLEAVKNASLLKAPAHQQALFADTLDEVLRTGEHLLLPYRTKQNDQFTVEIFIRINDELDYLPLIRVTDREGTVLDQQELRSYTRDEFICQISSISIGKRSVRISPRKNWYTEYFSLDTIRLRW